MLRRGPCQVVLNLLGSALYLMRPGAESWLEGVSSELIEEVQETRAEAKRSAAKLGTR